MASESSVPGLHDWLRALGLGEYVRLFEENAVDFATLQILTDADLKELGLPFGPRKRVLGALADLRRRQRVQVDPEGALPAPTRATERLERRQLTALFCDMVGFTDLAGRVDAETLQEVIRTYEHDCTECVERFGGHVLHSLGDGIVALFGFPTAHEDEAERAIRAGLRIVETMGRVRIPVVGRLRVRVGIARGLVVVSPAENRAIGETLNIAARLQGIADPDTVVVTDGVRHLAAGTFDFTDLGETSLKGVARPIRIFQATSERQVSSRFEAAGRRQRAPLVGRAGETAELRELWARARGGEGRLVLVTGEPGIGKSRIVSEVRDEIEAEGGFSLLLQCSALYSDSAFYPFIDALERMLGLGAAASPTERLDRLESLMVGRHGRPLEDVRFIGSLLSLPAQERYGAVSVTPRRRKEATIRALVDLLAALVESRPGLLFFEDLHWADPSTLEVLDLLVERLAGMRLLAVLTARPEFAFRWNGRPNASWMALARLTREEIGQMVDGLAVGRVLPREMVERIVGRTDGVPLFVEELTAAVLESRTGEGEAGDSDIPATLRDLLMARLDRVVEAKEVAQVGAVIGREFTHELITAVAPLDSRTLEDGLRQLIESGLAFRRGDPPSAVYTFKHALVQDAAYDSLLKSRRRELHASIATTLEDRFPHTREAEPELLARHYSEAGLASLAVLYWRRAGELAMRRFAHREASSHLRRGLALVESIPDRVERQRRELELRTLLGPAVVARSGWTAPEISGLMEPALVLAGELRHTQSYLPVLHLLWVNSMTSGRLERSREWAGRMLSTAEETGDADLGICGHRAAMTSAFWLGELTTARRHGDIIRQRYDRARHGHIATLTNSDPLTGDGIYRCQYLWMLGFPDQALEVSLENHRHARHLNHPFDLAFALTLGAQVREFRGEPEPLLASAAEGERVGREHGVPVMSEVLAELSKGIAWLRAGRVGESVPQLRQSFERMLQTGQKIWVPYLRALLAEALARSGELREAAGLLDESLQQVEAQGERPHLAEILRLKGCLLLESEQTDEGLRCLQESIEFSRHQEARSWELRTATSLAGWLARQGRVQEAVEVLEPAYAWFTEGFSTRDLRAARQLLHELGRTGMMGG